VALANGIRQFSPFGRLRGAGGERTAHRSDSDTLIQTLRVRKMQFLAFLLLLLER
jgi:hypothetical protein